MIRSACLAAAAAVVAAVLAGCSSSGNTGSSADFIPEASHLSGTEYFTAGTSSVKVIGSNEQKLPVRASGAFTDAGYITISTGSNSADKMITFPDGTIRLTSTSTATPKQGVDATNCRASETLSDGTYKISGGTGKFAGISGSGRADVTVTATLPRTAGGKCDVSSNARPTAAQETIAARGPIKIG